MRLRDFLYRLKPSEILHRRWVRREYNAHTDRLRRDVFMSIAAYAHVNRPIKGYYFEFGCHGAHTFRMAWDAFRRLFDWEFVAFDSFEGLPEIGDRDKQEIWQQGGLRTPAYDFVRTCHCHGIPANRFRIVQGFYDKTLNSHTATQLPHKAAVVYIDCDLYQSAVPVLEFCRPFLQKGTVIVFDDWACFMCDPAFGERRAWHEFRERYPALKFEPFLLNGFQAAFICTVEK